MKFLDEFRDANLVAPLLASIRARARRTWRIMEVCGGQTHSLLKHGLDEALAGSVELLHGPGCPVCVTPASLIDAAIDFARQPQTTLVSFGDMLRVPGSGGSLLDAKAKGGSVRMVYSPLDAVTLAAAEPSRRFIFFAVGFETTTPATALAVKRAVALELSNFFLLVAHVRVLPAMELLAFDPACRIDGFLGAGHVTTIIGVHAYRDFVAKTGKPVAVAGFEPVDLLLGIHELIDQLETGRAELVNCYRRSVSATGNSAAQRLVNEVYQPCDRPWRGLGTLPEGGWELRPEFAAYDARLLLRSRSLLPLDEECPSGLVMSGKMNPPECPHFATRCTPERPLGAPMVSTEGVCSAYFRYPRTGRAAERVGCS